MGADVSEEPAVSMKETGFFKILVCIDKTLCHDVPEDCSLDVHCHDSLRILKLLFNSVTFSKLFLFVFVFQ